jgi:hypothetical protein
MTTPISFAQLRTVLTRAMRGWVDQRTSPNRLYTLCDAGLAAFSVFFMQLPSFLAYQRQMQRQRGRNNASSLFGVGQIPTDPEIRNLLDLVAAKDVRQPFWSILAMVDDAGYLADYQYAGTWLLSFDGTGYFSSTAIHCANCSTALRGDTTYYSHSAVLPVLVRPGKAEVLMLEPEFITPQDGVEKQDCERNAGKRWIERNAGHFSGRRVTVLADDLYCNQPFCKLLVDQGLDFIMTCKPDSHPTLYEEVDALAKSGAVTTVSDRVWTGTGHELRTYRYVNQVPLSAEPQSLLVDWCEITVVREATGDVLYHNTFATNHDVTTQTVRETVVAGRARWKIENEGNNVLKNHGYHFEHNFGHGTQNLSQVLLSLLLLAFLCHTVLQLADALYQRVRALLVTRREFFDDLRALTRYMVFDSWEEMLDFMRMQLELRPP